MPEIVCSGFEETSKELVLHEVQPLSTAKQSDSAQDGNVNNAVAMSGFTEGKTRFILPYGAKRRPQQDLDSDSVPLRRLLCEQLEPEFRPGLKQNQRQLLLLLEGGAAKNSSLELAPIVLTPVFLLPGYEPSSEPPASRPSPSGSFGSLDAGALVHRNSGRTADDATGSEQAARTKASRGPPKVVS